MFAKRLRELSISFKLYSKEACGLARAIKSGRLTELDLPPSMRFDRIEVSNILDAQYVGVDAVLTTWGPLLSDNPFATIVGYFMNWTLLEEDGDPKTCKKEVIDACFSRVMDRDERVSSNIEWGAHRLILSCRQINCSQESLAGTGWQTLPLLRRSIWWL